MNESSTSWIAILTLYNESGPEKQQQVSEPYILSKEEATFIGRSKDCQIYLRPEYSNSSRYHAKVEFVYLEGKLAWQIWDLKTPNGTFVNNQKINVCQQLKSGDHLTLGKPKGASFIFEWKDIELTQLNEIFRKKHSYDETIVPNIDEGNGLEEKTQFFTKNLFDNQTDELHVNEIELKRKEFIKNTDENEVVLNSKTNSKNFVKSFPNGILALLFILVVFFLIYRIPESIETQKRRDESLASYIENISRLLLDKKLSSLNPYDLDARRARESANGQTLTTFKNLDGQAKGTLLRFLHGAKLIKIQPQKLSEEWFLNANLVSKKIVQLLSQGLTRSELVYTREIKINEFESNSLPLFLTNQAKINQNIFEKNNKKCTNLAQANNQNVDCAWVLEFNVKSYEQPFITPIQLSGADLTGVILKDAPLENINLEGAYISFQNCKQNFSGNLFKDNIYLKPIHWLTRNKCSADFSGAGLQYSRLFRSVLMGANLSNAKLDHADLRQVDLRGANLTGVSWQGAILNGACYLEKDWQNYFPQKGPDGKIFNPANEGMKAVSLEESDYNNSLLFKECKTINTSNSSALK